MPFHPPSIADAPQVMPAKGEVLTCATCPPGCPASDHPYVAHVGQRVRRGCSNPAHVCPVFVWAGLPR